MKKTKLVEQVTCDICGDDIPERQQDHCKCACCGKDFHIKNAGYKDGRPMKSCGFRIDIEASKSNMNYPIKTTTLTNHMGDALFGINFCRHCISKVSWQGLTNALWDTMKKFVSEQAKD